MQISARQAQESSPEFLRQRIADLERAGNRTQPDSGIELAQLRAEIAKLRPAAELAAEYAIKLREADETKNQFLQGLKTLLAKLEQIVRSVAVNAETARSTKASVAGSDPVCGDSFDDNGGVPH